VIEFAAWTESTPPAPPRLRPWEEDASVPSRAEAFSFGDALVSPPRDEPAALVRRHLIFIDRSGPGGKKFPGAAYRPRRNSLTSRFPSLSSASRSLVRRPQHLRRVARRLLVSLPQTAARASF
jgi:hypothetical protein